MDRLKAARKPIRALLTRTCNEVTALLQVQVLDEIELASKDGKLDELLEKIQVLDQQILDLYLDGGDEQGYDAEVMVIDQYNSDTRLAKIKIERRFQKVVHRTASECSISASTASSEGKQKRKFKLPKIELLKFSGKLIDWLSWWSQFEKIHTDDELHTTDKFEYLRQAMVPNTKAKDIVDGYPATEENYPKVIKSLKERFGKKKLLIQVYVRELFQMGIQNLNKGVVITNTFDKLVSHVRALETLGVTIEQAALFLYPMVEASLPEEIHTAWQRSPLYEKDGSAEDPPKNELDYLFQFLQQEVEREEQRQLVKASFMSKDSSSHADKKKENKNGKNTSTAASLFNGQSKPVTCIFCGKGHESKDCGSTEFWSMDELKKKVQENKACFYCLKPSHSAKNCKSFVKCHICSKKHFTIMCPELKEKKPIKNSESSSGSNFDCSKDVLMKTIMVYVVIGKKKRLARVLFDDGSQRSYATSSLLLAIQSKPFKAEYLRNILFDGTKTKCQKYNNHKVYIESLNGTKRMILILRERSVLGGHIARIPNGFWLDQFKTNGIEFTDLTTNNNSLAEIDIVIGSDYWGTVMNGQKEMLPCGLTAFETIWGWTLCGVVPQVSVTDSLISMFMAEEEVNKLWSLDVIGIKDPIERMTQAQEEMAAMKVFTENLKRNDDGRYVVNLPWVDEVPKIPNNKKVALSRLMSSTKKLNINNQFKTYDDIFKAWLDEGFIEKIESDNENGHYLPHHPVFKDSLTTPVRPVFDASCKTRMNLSLNDCLYKGPNFIESLPGKLIRFRMKMVGVLADIRKAFQMIEVDEKDREYLQFLWWEDDTQTKIIVLRHCRVVFGLKSSPFLLAAVLETLLSSAKESQKGIVEELKKSLYIDNCVTSLDSYEEYEIFKKSAVKIMEEGKFDLRQWECASPLESEEIVGPVETKVLGMVWGKKMDTLNIQVPKLEEIDKLTKRNIASALHKFFDPLGIIIPVLISQKIMLQRAWKQKSSWDCELPVAWKEEFRKWCSEASLLKEIKIPRLCAIPNWSNCQLHTFSDASENAYSAVVYLRTEHSREVKIQLVQSKSRVSPLAKASIPRLELLGCLIGSRLAQHSLESMELENIQKFFWTDSMTALAWIQRNSQWGTFVYNRVKRIRETTEIDEWRHVPGKLNPADLPSRGCNPKELLHSKWWEGPAWLRLPIEKWPNSRPEFDEDEINSEIKGKVSTSMFAVEEKSWFDIKFNKFSTKVRVMAWLQRFIFNVRNSGSKRKQKYLTITELRDAEIAMVRIIQQEVEMGPKEQKQIKKCMVPTTITDRGLLRLKTPMTKRRDTEGFRYPYLLPSKHPLVRDLILEAHINYCHAGSQFIMSKLREKFWITQAKKTISSVIHHCVTCQRFHSRKMDTIPTALPETRVKSGEVFDTTGVDLFGHITLKNGSKVWVVLYTCAVYRAIYLDVINSLSTKAFIKSLKRFIFRYGRPIDMISDNGTNFVGTANLFKLIDAEKLREKCAVEKIRWNFNPPAAPWWGGFYERMVRSVKEPLRKVLGRAAVNSEQLEMLLMEVSIIINDRPLTTITEDPEDLDPLTPNMFLRGTKNATFPEEEIITQDSLRKEWQRIQEYKILLQSRFRKEYLGQLVEHKRTNKSSVINVGDVVLIENDKKKRYQWPMGRVIEIMPSSDGVVRVVKIKTRRGCIIRSLRCLYPLEMSKSSSRPVPPEDGTLHPTKSNVDDGEVTLAKNEEIAKSTEEVTTRYGRKVKAPIRYTDWNE